MEIHITKIRTSFQSEMDWLSEKEDTYEPWSILRENAVLHQFLIANNKLSLIPARFRAEAEATFKKNRNRL